LTLFISHYTKSSLIVSDFILLLSLDEDIIFHQLDNIFLSIF